MDGQSIEAFETDLKKSNLYKIWNQDVTAREAYFRRRCGSWRSKASGFAAVRHTNSC